MYAAEWEQSIAVGPDVYEKRLAKAREYLREVTRTYASTLQGIKTELDVETGAVAPAILSAARLEATDLIVLCSHGETGLTRWILGSVARESIRQSPVPLLVLNESGGIFLEQPAIRPVRVLVPLDGSDHSEEALQPALLLLAAVAPRSDGELHLLHIVDLPATYGSTRSQIHIPTSMHEEARQEAEIYLTDLAAHLRDRLPAETRPAITWSVAVNPDVAGAILARAAEATHEQENGSTIIALATHGHSGLRTLLMGSVTARLLGVSKQPLLIVRPQQKAPERTPAPGRSKAGMV
jgi:nucleotide-binding universal stress UspA family protein